MADAKISALTNLTAADAINDMIPIVDVSDTPPASGNTKRISINNILSSSPTASGALTVTGLVTAGSATITGDLTVRTNKLAVTSTGVGLGTASPAVICDVTAIEADIAIFRSTGAGGNDKRLTITSGGDRIVLNVSDNTNTATARAYVFQSAGTERYRIAADGVATWAVAGTTAMTLNATGLGVNITPSVRLHASDSDNPANGTLRLGSATVYGQIKNSASSTGKLEFTSVGTGVNGGYNFSIEGQNAHRIEASGVFSWFDGAGGTRMALNASGLGLGTATFGTSAAKVLAIGTGTEPTTGPAGTVQLFTSTRSASNTIPAIFTEGSGVTNAAITNTTVTNKIAIKVNGTIYYLLATTSAA